MNAVLKNMFSPSVMFDRVCANPERKKKSFLFAMMSIGCSIIGAAAALFAMFMFNLGKSDAALNVLGIILGACFAIAAVGVLISAIIYLSYQFKINKKPMTYIALVVLILGFVGIAVGVPFLLF